jgi:hypothetical protein
VHGARIGAEHTVDIGPDLDDRSVDSGANDCSCVIGSISSDCGRLTFFRRADEPCHDRDHPAAMAPDDGPDRRFDFRIRFAEHDVRIRELIVRHDDVPGVHVLSRVLRSQAGGHNRARQPFTEARNHVERLQRTVTKEANPVENPAQFGQQTVDLVPDSLSISRDECRYGTAMATCQILITILKGSIRSLGQSSTLDELIGHTTKSRHDNDQLILSSRREDDPLHATNRRRRLERRTTEF